MAQGGQSDWERQLAAQQREEARQARERERLAKERQKAAREKHVATQETLTENKNRKLAAELHFLDQILLTVLGRQPLTFDQLKVRAANPTFRAAHLSIP